MTETTRARLRRLQRRFAETPFQLPVTIAYTLSGTVGLASGNGIVPHTIDRTLPFALVVVWTLYLALGGWLSVVGRLLQRERLEFSGLVLLGFGSGLYAVVLAVVGRWPSSITAAAAMAGVAAGCGIRLLVLNVSRKARTVAAQIEGDESEKA